ncbi:MAG: hypothetical protein FJW36_26270 [Acidobacteria bacterium]|nr:hypothetical protein [Acidobacteriota bacterium]
MNQDSFFGFYPTVSGAFKVNKTLDWTAYGIFWTTPSFGTGGGGGLWTEVGSGVNIRTFDGKWTFTPQLGILNGKLLSNGSFPMAFEGFVPNITSNVNTTRAEGEFYMGRYTAARTGRVQSRPGGPLVDAANRNNFLHWWINGGFKVSPQLSAGLHYEHLGSNPSGTLPSGSVYKWLGPYVQMSLSSNFAVRFTAGPDVQSRPATDGTGSFYKLSATYTFP